jgi:hypothetical protein
MNGLLDKRGRGVATNGEKRIALAGNFDRESEVEGSGLRCKFDKNVPSTVAIGWNTRAADCATTMNF